MQSVYQALADLHQRYQEAYAAAQCLPQTEYISNWDAPCYQGKPKSGEIGWKAVPQEPALDFGGLEHGLEMPIQDSVKAFFSSFFAGDMVLRFREQFVTLLQVMHPEDGERLQQNLVGHVLMKQRLRQPVTLFIGLTDEDDLLVTVNNTTGAVGLEYVGQEQHAILAGDLEAFLERLEPIVVDPD